MTLYRVIAAFTLAGLLGSALSVGADMPVAADELTAAVARFQAVRRGEIKSVEQFSRLRGQVHQPDAAALPAAAPPPEHEGILKLDEKRLVEKDRVIARDTVTGLERPLMIHTRTVRELGNDVLPASGEQGMTLGEAIRSGLETGYGIRIGRHDVALAGLDLMNAWRQRLPSLSFHFARTKLNKMEMFPGLSSADDDQSSYNFQLQLPVYTFGRIRFGEKAARYARYARMEEFEQSVVDMAFNVKKAFYGILLAEKFVDVAAQSLKQIGNHVRTVKSQFDVGMASRFDLLRIEVQRANTQPELIRAELVLKNARDGLNMLLGRPVETPIVLKGSLEARPGDDEEVDAMVGIALLQRQDLKKARRQLQAVRMQREAVRRGTHPTLALQSTYSQAWGNRVMPNHHWDESWNANMVLQWSFFDGRGTEVETRKMDERLRQAEIAVEMTENQVKLDVRQAVNELTQSRALIRASEKTVEQAEEALAIANVSFENGLNTNLEVMDAQLALDRARTNHYQALHDWLVARAKLDKALGTIGEL